ncbi:uncharacterized protein LOC143283519 [Babylonia areolata]|uniref:uncharacterized protein LOC143283519 n=1 Tax=Babylonia areolata TaxID=304850 RepID=UPI003FCFD5BC
MNSNGNMSSSSNTILSDALNETQADPIGELCMVVNLSAFQFHDESKDVMSAQVSSVVNNVIHAVLFPALIFIGFPSNMVNMVVFFRHGLKQRINLCLFCLSALDLLFVTMAFLIYMEKLSNKDFTTSYRKFGQIAMMIFNNHLNILYSGSVFSSQYVSAVIAGERCICVVWPLKSSTLLKTRTIGIVLLVGSLVVFGVFSVVSMKYRMICILDSVSGLTAYYVVTSEFYRTNEKLVNTLDGLVNGAGLPVSLCTFVLITTVITAVHLQKSSQFQNESSSSSATTLSARNVAVTRMLIYLSIQFIVLNTPTMLFRISFIFLPELSVTKDWANLFFCFMAITELCCVISSSVNFLVYYFFGSKYRESVLEMLCMGRKRNF